MCCIELTKEGTKKFFEMLKQPNPARDRIIEESKGISTPEQRQKFGKERVYVDFKLKSHRIED